MAASEAMFNPADKTAPAAYKPSQTALLLLDFHKMFVEHAGGPAAASSVAAASNMQAWAASQGIQVVHALIDVNAPPFPTCKDFDRFANIITSMKSGGGDVEAAELQQGSPTNDVTFTRQGGHVSALKSPGLEEFLHGKGIKSLVLAGLSTSGCVMRTAFAACDAQFVVTVISDACADPAEGVHDFVIGKLLNNRGYVASAAEFQKGYAQAQA